MNEEKANYIAQWIAKANQDCLAVEILLKDDPLSVAGVIGFHCQQSIEKFLKAFLVLNDFDFSRTHNLEELKDKCSEYDSDFLVLNYLDLTDYAVNFRYPDGEYIPEMKEIETYYYLVQKTKELVLSKIKID